MAESKAKNATAPAGEPTLVDASALVSELLDIASEIEDPAQKARALSEAATILQRSHSPHYMVVLDAARAAQRTQATQQAVIQQANLIVGLEQEHAHRAQSKKAT